MCSGRSAQKSNAMPMMKFLVGVDEDVMVGTTKERSCRGDKIERPEGWRIWTVALVGFLARTARGWLTSTTPSTSTRA